MSPTIKRVYRSAAFKITTFSDKKGGIYNDITCGEVGPNVPITEQSVRDCIEGYELKPIVDDVRS